jgi:hypothetical protein
MLTCKRVNEVRGFFLLGGVRCWYGWPMRLANGNPEKESNIFKNVILHRRYNYVKGESRIKFEIQKKRCQ